MAGRALEAVYPRVPHTPGETLLELDAVRGERLPLHASLALRRGEIMGIAGLVGAGRTELLRALFGLDALRSGRISIAGCWDRGARPATRLAAGVGMLSESRKDEGLALGLSIATNITLPAPPARFGFISRAAQATATRDVGTRLGLRHRDGEQVVAELSGGNQQKVALGRLLYLDADVFLLDEPTRGIDVGSKVEIYRQMGELAARGKAILFVSSYLPELLGVCDCIAVMHRGQLTAPRPVEAWDETRLLRAASAGTDA
jgi:ribose transport system ATP-binding protein